MQIVNRHARHFNTLTRRERQVLARGRVNKQIAFDLGISQVAVKLHRSNAKDAGCLGRRSDTRLGGIARSTA